MNNNILSTAIDWSGQGRAIAVATVLETWGSAPQPVGSRLVIDANGEFEGSVSGGCVEAAVITEAVELIQTNGFTILEFGVANEAAWQVGLACGGRIKILVESIDERKLHNIAAIVAAHDKRQPVSCITDLESGAQTVSYSVPELAASRIEDNSFIHVYESALQLIIIGAVHISQAVIPIARLADYEITVIDPRSGFASRERFPDVELHAGWPDEVLKDYTLDRRTAFIALTHDPKIDDPALRMALPSECFYIGALGSRRTHAARLERMKDQQGLERIKGPIGLDIGARGAAEIAISIMAQMTAALRHHP